VNNGVLWLRVCYWFGAIADLVNGIVMLVPTLSRSMFGLSEVDVGMGYKYALWMGAPLMLGWALLLVWADRKPVERKGVLLLTLFPVIFGLILAAVFAVTSGFVSADRMIPIWVLQAVLVLLFGFGYVNARGTR
jgi:hypothetical protein